MGGSSGGGMIGGLMSAAISIADQASSALFGSGYDEQRAAEKARLDNSVPEPVDERTPEQIAADNEAADTAAGNANPETKKKAEGKSLPGALGRDE